jgi:acyl carrier protein
MEVFTFEDFKTILADNLGLDVTDIDKDSAFSKDLRIDSLSIINFIIKLERKLRIKISNESLLEMTSIEKAYEIIKARVQSRE